MKLISKVKVDEFTKEIGKAFDYDFDGESIFEVPNFQKDKLPEDYNIGLIVGSSGSGKSSILREYFNYTEEELEWDNTVSTASNFESPQDAIDKLGAVGLNSIPSIVRPFNVLSNGEQFRATMARKLKDNAIIDEFTSVVDRTVAKSCSVSISKYIRKNNLKNMVFASCHRDIVEWLNPDWVFDCDTGELLVGRSLWQRPTINLEVYESSYKAWPLYSKYHYLSADINKACKCFEVFWGDVPVAFVGVLFLPGKIPPLYEGDNRGKYRESRLVVIPSYQGLGMGNKISEAIGQYFINQGFRYFCKTAHPRMGEHRQHSDLWRATSTNLKSREKSQKCSKKEAWHHLLLDTHRLCYSHELLGPRGTKYRDLYEKQRRKDKEAKKLEKQKKLFIKNIRRK